MDYQNKRINGYFIIKKIIIKNILFNFFNTSNININRINIIENNINTLVNLSTFSSLPLNEKQIKIFIFYLEKHIALKINFKKKIKIQLNIIIIDIKEPFIKSNPHQTELFFNNFFNKKNWGYFFLNYIVKKLETSNQHIKVLENINTNLSFFFKEKKKNILGLKIKIKGRLNGSDRSKTIQLKYGKLPSKTKKILIKSYFIPAHTQSGTIGVTIQPFFKKHLYFSKK